MFAITYRPQAFRNMKGAELNRSLLIKIAKNPEKSPKTLILAGAHGTGKSSSARIFARALNCETGTGDACNRCASCVAASKPPLYQELDAGMFGKAEEIRNMRDTFSYSLTTGYRVIVFDEMHLSSNQAQGNLLKVIEEVPKNVFFIFATTDPEKLLPTIHSRSVYLEYEPIPAPEIKALLQEISSKEGIPATDELLDRIIIRAGGHARDALQLLSVLHILGPEDFSSYLVSLESEFVALFQAFADNNLQSIKDRLGVITRQPLRVITQDYSLFIRKLSDKVFLEGDSNVQFRQLVVSYLKNHRFLQSTSDWYCFLSSMKAIFEKKAPTVATDNRFKRA